MNDCVAEHIDKSVYFEAVTRLWKDILEVDDVGASDDFFDNGGNSVLLIGFITALQKETGKLVPFEKLSQGVSVGSLCDALEKIQ